MPPQRTGQDPPMNNDMVIGEMRGQLRELVHSVNNQSSKIDGMATQIAALGPIAADIAALKGKVAKLEESANQQTGAGAVVKMILNSPLAYWIIGLAAFIWLTLTGRVKVSP